ncbi:MAG: hypothetical protein PHG82_03245 [Candidatus Gracilibacteria bacterium]|nr:hypothetical protein [Candidatus Gracilibacteria bacterium]
MEMTDINDIKGKLDIINYSLLYFFVLAGFFLYLFYYFLSKFLSNEQIIEEKVVTKKGLFDDIKTRLESINLDNDEEFYKGYSRVFFDFSDIIFGSDLRKKTLKELKKTIKDKEILDIIGAFYYKGFMDNFSSTSEEKYDLIAKFMKQITKREAN